MALTLITIDTQTNPLRGNAGRESRDATIINSGLTGTVIYSIRRRDRATHGTSDGSGVLTFTSSEAFTNSTQVVAISDATLEVILPFRQELQVRVSDDAGATWSNWVNFKTRDKRYQSPDAITQIDDDRHLTAATEGSRTYNITNSAKAVVVDTDAGATVTVTDFGYVATSNIEETDAGATVTNADPYQSPNGNITIG